MQADTQIFAIESTENLKEAQEREVTRTTCAASAICVYFLRQSPSHSHIGIGEAHLSSEKRIEEAGEIESGLRGQDRLSTGILLRDGDKGIIVSMEVVRMLTSAS